MSEQINNEEELEFAEDIEELTDEEYEDVGGALGLKIVRKTDKYEVGKFYEFHAGDYSGNAAPVADSLKIVSGKVFLKQLSIGGPGGINAKVEFKKWAVGGRVTFKFSTMKGKVRNYVTIIGVKGKGI